MMFKLIRVRYGKFNVNLDPELKEYQFDGSGPVGTLKEWKEKYPNATFELKDRFADGSINENKDICPECGSDIDDEDYIGSNESRGEFWGAPCSEYVCYGYKCKNCGYKEDF